ncbi:hypothetical protein J6TS7_05150 [Paenibacillus dendritiformis]|nr:hypothetical protein J6TS7_05150 [Paenibacillus dendritiformis]
MPRWAAEEAAGYYKDFIIQARKIIFIFYEFRRRGKMNLNESQINIHELSFANLA